MSIPVEVVLTILGILLTVGLAVLAHHKYVSGQIQGVHGRITRAEANVADKYVRRDDFKDFADRLEAQSNRLEVKIDKLIDHEMGKK